jgi:hypothetical protein
LQARLGWAVENRSTLDSGTQQTLERVQRIWAILQETQGVDLNHLVLLLPKLLAKPEAQDLGQRVIGGVTQRALVRLLREVLLAEPAEQDLVN